MGGQRKKKGGRVTPKGGPPGRLTAAERAGLEDIFDEILRSAPVDPSDEIPALAVEIWASHMWSTWANSELIGLDTVEVFGGGVIKYAAKRATPGALMTLRALAAVAPDPYGCACPAGGRTSGLGRGGRTALGRCGRNRGAYGGVDLHTIRSMMTGSP